jgi:hypothetical protein
MIGLAEIHTAFKAHLKVLKRNNGQLFFPQAGQVMYAPALERSLRENPQGAINKVGFFFQGDGPFQHFTYKLASQILLTFPAAATDDDYIRALAFADEFVSAINDQTIEGVGLMTRADGPTPLPNLGVLGVRADFTTTTLS